MSIEEIEKVDFIGVDDERVNLLISDHLEWNEKDDQHLYLLQEKVNAYLRFYESGEMVDKYPKALNRQVEFEIAFRFTPNARAYVFLEQLKHILNNAGIKLILNTSR